MKRGLPMGKSKDSLKVTKFIQNQPNFPNTLAAGLVHCHLELEIMCQLPI